MTTCQKEVLRDIKAVLFDLDGTLLDIDIDFFLQKYFERMVALARQFGIAGHDSLVQHIWRSTEAMIANKDVHRTNQEVFEEAFFRDFPEPPETMKPFFDHFYEYSFASLKDCCQPYPLVADIMAKVFAKGLRVVIATNPLFPLTALQHRLNWAGVGSFPYELITSYEVMHFTKPHVEYYHEIIDFLGLKPGECLMVGNDVYEDLSAARTGMKTFLLKERLLNHHNLPVKADWEGYLPDLANLVDKIVAPVKG